MSKAKKDPKSQNNVDEDIFYEENVPDGEQGSSFASKDSKKLKEDLKKCQKEKQEYLDGWQRAKADFVNLKKRAEQDKKEFAKYANEEFVVELLPVMDSFDQATANKEAWEQAPAEWRTGIEFIHTQLKTILENHGVKELDPVGETFDPEHHHSVDTVKVESPDEDDKIVEVTQKGYALGEKIIRHPSVRVGKL
jgi:molecular chaperone GrpE